MVFNLPYPPSVNNYWIASGHRRYVSKRGVQFKKDVANIFLESKLAGFRDKPVEVYVVLHPKNKRLMDIDNCLKPVLDSFIGFAYDDDKQINKIVIARGCIIPSGMCVVRIELSPTLGESSVN